MNSKEIDAFVRDIILYTKNTINNINLIYLIYILLFLTSLFFLMYVVKRKILKKYKLRNELLDNLINNLNLIEGLEKNLGGILELLRLWFEVQSYSFYTYDKKNDKHVLKAVLHSDENNGPIKPSYSGLLPFKKEQYLPPLVLPLKNIPSNTALTIEGAVTLLTIPVKGMKGVIQLGPIKRVRKKEKVLLDYLSEKLQPIIDMLLEAEVLKNKIQVTELSTEAVNNISNMMTDLNGIMMPFMRLSCKVLNSDGGFLLNRTKDTMTVSAFHGVDNETLEFFKADFGIHTEFDRLMGNDSLVIIEKDSRDYFRIPSYIAALGVKTLALLNISNENYRGLAVFWYNTELSSDTLQTIHKDSSAIIAKQLENILKTYEKYKLLSISYIDMLKMLAQSFDNSNPFTVAYSELMYRFSLIIAMEMNLDSNMAKDIALAAYFCNIGVLGLSGDLSEKTGKFSEMEYEIMKLHADIGASIVESTIADHRIASYIRHHHERMDGFGYPSGLKGDEIPLGARIIAVVQTFLAKINGRKDREPLSFSQSLNLLVSSAGSQLDTEVVNAFTNWFKKKSSTTLRKESALGYCWEMRCSPSYICSSCPAYKNTEKNCWEFGGLKCIEHGNKCNTCFIHTEYLDRNSMQV